MFLENTPITRFILLFGCLSASFFSATGTTCVNLILAASTPGKRDAAMAACIPSWMVAPSEGVIRNTPITSDSGFPLHIFWWCVSIAQKLFRGPVLRTSLMILPFLSLPAGPLSMNVPDGILTFWIVLKLRELEKRWGSGRFLSFLLTMSFAGSVYARFVLYRAPFRQDGSSGISGKGFGSSFAYASALNDLLRIFSCLGSLVPLTAMVTRFDSDVVRHVAQRSDSHAWEPATRSRTAATTRTGNNHTSDSTEHSQKGNPSSVFLWIALAKLVLFPGGSAVLAHFGGGIEETRVLPRIGAFFLGCFLGSSSTPPVVKVVSSLSNKHESSEEDREERGGGSAQRVRRDLMMKKGSLLYRWILFFSIHFCRPLCRALDPFFSIFSTHRNTKGVKVIHHTPSRLRSQAETGRVPGRAGPLHDVGIGMAGEDISAAGQRGTDVQAPGTRIDRVIDDSSLFSRDRPTRRPF